MRAIAEPKLLYIVAALHQMASLRPPRYNGSDIQETGPLLPACAPLGSWTNRRHYYRGAPEGTAEVGPTCWSQWGGPLIGSRRPTGSYL